MNLGQTSFSRLVATYFLNVSACPWMVGGTRANIPTTKCMFRGDILAYNDGVSHSGQGLINCMISLSLRRKADILIRQPSMSNKSVCTVCNRTSTQYVEDKLTRNLKVVLHYGKEKAVISTSCMYCLFRKAPFLCICIAHVSS